MTISQQELQERRKDLKKRKLPELFDNMWGSEPGIGGFQVFKDGIDFRIEWVIGASEKSQPRQKALYSELNNSPDLESTRYSIGMMISALCIEQARKVIASIGGPKEAMRESKPMRDAAEIWEHWAIVPAGYFLK